MTFQSSSPVIFEFPLILSKAAFYDRMTFLRGKDTLSERFFQFIGILVYFERRLKS